MGVNGLPRLSLTLAPPSWSSPRPPSLTLPPRAGEENVDRTACAVRMLKLEGEGTLMFTAVTFPRTLLRLKARGFNHPRWEH